MYRGSSLSGLSNEGYSNRLPRFPANSYNTYMSTITLLELQQQAGSVLDRILAGEKLLVVRDGCVVAELSPIQPTHVPTRPRGRCAGLFRVPDDFDAPLPEEILRGFEGR